LYRPATWLDGYRYARAGVVLIDLYLYLPGQLSVANLFTYRDPETSKALMGALDALNSSISRTTLRPGAMARAGTGHAAAILTVLYNAGS